MEKISTTLAPAAIGPYSQGIKCNGMLYASGQIPLDPATGQLVSGGISEQAHQAFRNVKALVEAAGTTMSSVVKVTVFMADMSDFVTVNEIYAQYFSAPYPARSAVAVKALPKGALLEVEVVAAIKE